MRLLILAGGLGTRLKTAIADVPKALAPIGDVPFLQLQLENWITQGLREFTFLLHHQANQIITFLRSQQTDLLKYSQVNFIIEPKPLDTGGSIAHAVKKLDLKEDFLLTNADTWLSGGIYEMMQSCSPSMAVVSLQDVGRYGQVHFNHENFVTSFSEKNGYVSAGWINAGLCRLNVEHFKNWDCEHFSLERDLFPKLVQKSSLKAVPVHTDFIDIGIPDDYHRFCRWEAAGRLRPLCN